jgi:hypothetical protein
VSLPHGKTGVRVNVSIPKALWDQAQVACPGMNDSKIVQTALRKLVSAQRRSFEDAGASPTGVLVEFDR